MRVKVKKIVLLVFLLLIIFLHIFFGGFEIDNTYQFLCKSGTIDIILCCVILCIWQKKIVTSVNMFFAAFCLFQFGIPILNALNSNYENWYLTLFSEETIISASRYSVYAIIVASLAICLSQINSEGILSCKERKWEKYFNKHEGQVSSAAFYMFLVTAAVVIPMTSIAVTRQLASGMFTIANRNIMSTNAALRFAQEFFYSSCFLYLCFSNNKLYRRIVKIIFSIACFNMLLLADRAIGLVGIFLLLYYRIYFDKNKSADIHPKRRNLVFIIVIILAAIVMAFIAKARTGGKGITEDIIFGLFKSVVEEFGFNFTSICFVMDYIPRVSTFKFGASYGAGFINLIPSSLDLFNIKAVMSPLLGETWLYNMNNLHEREFLNFGVGFSLIGESYMNFAWGGLVMIFVITYLVARLLKSNLNSTWRNYTQLIMLFNLLLLPRRQFAVLLKSVEYGIFFMGLYLWAFISLRRINHGENKS